MISAIAHMQILLSIKRLEHTMAEQRVRSAEFEERRMRIEAEYRQVLEDQLRRAKPQGRA